MATAPRPDNMAKPQKTADLTLVGKTAAASESNSGHVQSVNTPVASEGIKSDVEEKQSGETGGANKANIILNAVRDLSALHTSMEEIRGELRARGVQGQATNVMVEMAFHGRHDERQGLIEAALDASKKAYGHGAITREELQSSLDNMLTLEKDVAYTRRLCRQSGLDLQVINFLTQLIRQNPGDGGQKAVNTLLGYAQACHIELSGIDAITQKYTTEPESVLPDIQRPEPQQSAVMLSLVKDIVVGVILTIVLMTFLV